MNEIRIHGLLQDRYETKFVGVLRKILLPTLRTSCYCSKSLASHPVGRAMRQPLGETIKNAINKALLTDKELQYGALIVGGRRRNRKKRNKNKSARNKKNAKKEEGKTRGALGEWNNQEDNYDESPLIENEVKSNTKSEVEANQEQGTDPDLDQGQEPVVSPEQDKENIHPNKMPIKDFFKTTRKKKEKKEKKEKKKKEKELQKAADENATADGNTDQQESKEQGPGVKPGTLAALAQTVPKLPDPPRNWDSDPDPDPDAEQNVVDGGETYVPPETVIEDIINVTEETQDEKEKTEGEKPTDPEGPEVKPMEIAEPVKKSEKSPLIKESKLKDTGPGFLCCTIL
ncbi:FACT complex subunit SSRP1-A-like isoform X2 [Gigantopelta aegis]|uniref:FACT complex subunit SSRP1-A-like isoform X2 n=1 Tax=Gigantopelta aegis TaxID=1735272 RepID=UPI001B88776F|nr:FACT complex subunit SSRP1-A-like isoform X2 [Gigantopelta aegis]